MKDSITVFLTGGAGYIGSQVAWFLKDHGFKVICLDNLSLGHKELMPLDVHFIQGDTRDRALLDKIFSENNIQAVLHFAALKDTAESMQKPLDYYDNNFVGTCNLLECCKQYQIKKFIFSSTAAVYAPQESGVVSEGSRLEPATPYGQSKLMSEKMIMDCAQAWGLEYMVLRYFNVAGADSLGRSGPKGGHHTALIKKAAEVASGKKELLTIFGNDYRTKDGTGVRDYIHVEDLAELHVRALKHLLDGGSSEILNCGYGHGYSVLDVVHEVSRCLKKDIHIQVGPRREGDLAEVVADVSKMKHMWGWQPQKDDLSVICGSTIKWEMSLS